MLLLLLRPDSKWVSSCVSSPEGERADSAAVIDWDVSCVDGSADDATEVEFIRSLEVGAGVPAMLLSCAPTPPSSMSSLLRPHLGMRDGEFATVPFFPLFKAIISLESSPRPRLLGPLIVDFRDDGMLVLV